MPAYVLKKFRKNVSRKTTPTLDQIPIPNHTINIGASAVRGMPLSAMMIGSKTSASRRLRPKAEAKPIPRITPAGKPIAISWSVTQQCWMSSPELKPAIIDFRMRLGLLMRKASIQRCEAISQRRKNPPTKAMRTSAIQIRRLEMKPLRSTAALRSLVVASIVMMLMGIDIQLVAEDVPEPAVGFVEAFLAVNLENIARPLHRHLDDVLHARGAMRHHDHAVGERDRLHQIVGYEQDRLALLLPDLQ